MSGHPFFLVFSCSVYLLPLSSGLAFKSQLDQVVLLYPGQVRSEGDLDTCKNGGICSIVHDTFWIPPRAERLCRCPGGEECPYTLAKPHDNRTLFLNNRAQMKTCNRTDEMPKCKLEQTALIIEETQTEAFKERKVLATAFCTCENPKYWTLQKHFLEKHPNGTTHMTSHYHCTNLGKCKVDEHCANVRLDYYSTYQHCLCPKGQQCLANKSMVTNVTELLFSGLAYRAYCSPFPSTE
ncbi:unnamed protein product [Bemisia tabaci]|uniref:Uncharacterized protein n=1 Tax=Bemisia tabaci TaxID=7038 RepID=A0A9P0F5D0_BEMTA|nr:unnamed protein product [Bemisia tabaci]